MASTTLILRTCWSIVVFLTAFSRAAPYLQVPHSIASVPANISILTQSNHSVLSSYPPPPFAILFARETKQPYHKIEFMETSGREGSNTVKNKLLSLMAEARESVSLSPSGPYGAGPSVLNIIDIANQGPYLGVQQYRALHGGIIPWTNQVAYAFFRTLEAVIGERGLQEFNFFLTKGEEPFATGTIQLHFSPPSVAEIAVD